jgi:hypothetical protein
VTDDTSLLELLGGGLAAITGEAAYAVGLVALLERGDDGATLHTEVTLAARKGGEERACVPVLPPTTTSGAEVSETMVMFGELTSGSNCAGRTRGH